MNDCQDVSSLSFGSAFIKTIYEDDERPLRAYYLLKRLLNQFSELTRYSPMSDVQILCYSFTDACGERWICGGQLESDCAEHVIGMAARSDVAREEKAGTQPPTFAQVASDTSRNSALTRTSRTVEPKYSGLICTIRCPFDDNIDNFLSSCPHAADPRIKLGCFDAGKAVKKVNLLWETSIISFRVVPMQRIPGLNLAALTRGRRSRRSICSGKHQ